MPENLKSDWIANKKKIKVNNEVSWSHNDTLWGYGIYTKNCIMYSNRTFVMFL